MASVSLDRVRKVYDRGVEAVRDLTLHVRDGEFVALVGPSGCGKSTTLRVIAGLEEADGGTIRIGDRVVNAVHPKDRDVAMVFQNYALYPHMTVRENMSFALRLRGTPKAEVERRVREAARMLDIEGLLDRRPRQLSGGQRQRVAVGRAIVREPQAFLFDEPLSNLDARLRLSTRAELKALHLRLRTTTIYVTHDQEEAMTLGDRVVVMHAGVIRQTGTPFEVYSEPADRFVAGFVGTPGMNFLEGRFEAAEGGVWFTTSGGARLRCADAHADRLARHAPHPAVLGVRPQAISLGAGRPGATLAARVRLVELLGDVMDVVCDLDSGEAVVARLAARPGLAPGDRTELAVEMGRAHAFEPGELGRSLLHGGNGAA
ncbi:MAG TPA: sn-glycerol-3-phosphate ABC transporter ATP-binding protein UgpC [Phycisphaerales bacterium]|nr:sn-glycerol-3-phosphate ABC transporter ATP-binding protein UgpC [Phycisphaerales bacterium]